MPGTKGHSGGHNRRSLADHELRGTYRASRHAGLVDPPTAAAAPVGKPTRLSTGAAAVWDELAPLATALGTLTASDVRAFGTLCELECSLAMALSQTGTSASHAGQRAAARAVLPWFVMFGLAGPASRARLHLTPAADRSANPLDRFLSRTPLQRLQAQGAAMRVGAKWPELK